MVNNVDIQYEQIDTHLEGFKKDILQLKKEIKSTESLSESPIPPNIKTLYKTLTSLNKEDISKIIFTIAIKNATVDDVMSGRIWETFITDFGKYIKTSQWKKADQNVKEFIGISDENPIAIRWGGIGYGEEIEGKQRGTKSLVVYLSNTQQGEQPLLVFKEIYGQKWSYEPWSVYIDSFSWEKQKVTILPKKNNDGSYHLEDIEGKVFSWRYTIGLDGNLYEVDENMEILMPNGQRYIYDAKIFNGLRYGDMSIIYADGVFSFPYVSEEENNQRMKAEKILQKQQNIQEQCQKEDRYAQWYRLIMEDDNEYAILEKNGVKSEVSPSIFLYGKEWFTLWITQAIQKVNEGIKANETKDKQAEKKDKVFNDFVLKYCDSENPDMPGIFPLKKEVIGATALEEKYISGLQWYNHRYGIQKWQKTEYNRQENIIVIDLVTGVPIENHFYYPTKMTDTAGNSIPDTLGNIYMSIKRQENKSSYIWFFEKYYTGEDASLIKYGSFPDISYSYKGKTYTIKFDGMRDIMNNLKDKRAYLLHINGNKIEGVVEINKDMKIEDIEKSINVAIDGSKEK